MKSKTNIDKITNLTSKWYTYVNMDHHKNRDCIWNIEIKYAYGEAPKYYAYHHGYIINDWTSPECDTLEDAEQWLINKLERELEKAKIHLQDIISFENDEERYWCDPEGKAEKILEYING